MFQTQKVVAIKVMCIFFKSIVWFQKVSIPPLGRPNFYKKSMKLNWNFLGLRGCKTKNTFHGGVGIFSGLTHWLI